MYSTGNCQSMWIFFYDDEMADFDDKSSFFLFFFFVFDGTNHIWRNLWRFLWYGIACDGKPTNIAFNMRAHRRRAFRCQTLMTRTIFEETLVWIKEMCAFQCWSLRLIRRIFVKSVAIVKTRVWKDTKNPSTYEQKNNNEIINTIYALRSLWDVHFFESQTHEAKFSHHC